LIQTENTVLFRINTSLTFLGYGYAAAGRKVEAQKVLDQLNEFSKGRYVPAFHRAIIYAGLGEKDKAFEWLRKAYEEEHFIIAIKVHPAYDPLRSDPRFADLLRRMNLQP
jgi:tetratricopeptide (TPR) repeat protein